MRLDRPFVPDVPAPLRRSGWRIGPGIALLLALLMSCGRHNAPPAEEAKSLGPDGQPIHGQARGQSAAAHLSVKGDYRVDVAPPTFCTLNVDKAFQVTWRATPEVVLRIENFRGTGEYEAEVRVRATYTGEAYRTSMGKTKVSLQVTAAPSGSGSLVSGSFSSAYKGESGKGTVSGSFERCPYDITDTAL